MRWIVIKVVVFLCQKSRVRLQQWSGNERIGFEEGIRGSKKVQKPVMTMDTGKNVDVGEGRWNWWFLKWVWSENWHRRRPGGAGSWILCVCTCWGVGVCVQTPGSAASCYKSYFEVGFDNLISSAALFHLWGKKEHILQEKLQAQFSLVWNWIIRALSVQQLVRHRQGKLQIWVKLKRGKKGLGMLHWPPANLENYFYFYFELSLKIMEVTIWTEKMRIG